MVKTLPVVFRDLEAYDLKEIILLEGLITQYVDIELFKEERESLIRYFIDLKNKGLARAEVIETKDSLELVGYFVLLFDDKVIERFWAIPEAKKNQIAYLAQIAVKEKYQKQGFGSYLLKEIEKRVKELNKMYLRLEVASISPAFNWYLKKDFLLQASIHYLEKDLSTVN